jgi:hypothetical protein
MGLSVESLQNFVAIDRDAQSPTDLLPTDVVNANLGPRVALQSLIIGQRRVIAVTAAIAAVGMLSILGFTFAFAGARSLGDGSLVLSGLVALVPWILLYLSTVVPQARSKELRRTANAMGLELYFAGTTPYAGRWHAMGKHYMFIVERDGHFSRLRFDDISVVGVDVRVHGALVAIATGNRLLGVAVPGRVGGPFTLRWSFDGLLGIGKLRRALLSDLEARGVIVTDVDVSHV